MSSEFGRVKPDPQISVKPKPEYIQQWVIWSLDSQIPIESNLIKYTWQAWSSAEKDHIKIIISLNKNHTYTRIFSVSEINS